jgi:hypothetical protein
MWNVKTRVIPVIIGAIGTISRSFRKYVSNIPGNHEVRELQKNSHIGHCTHTYFRKYQCNSTKHLMCGKTLLCGTNCRYGAAATLYTL